MDDRASRRSARSRSAARLLLAGLLLSASLAAPALGENAAARASACERPSDRGYADGLAGKRRPKSALSRCPSQAATYRSAYRAGAYVRSLNGKFGGGVAAPIRPAPGATGASSGAFERSRPLDAGTRSTLRRSRCGLAAGRAVGASGGPYPEGCGPGAATARGFDQGRTQRRVQAEAARSNMERSRLNTRLLSPSLSAGERRMIQNRLRALNQQQGLRRIQDPLLR